jgi:hypothetical protein
MKNVGDKIKTALHKRIEAMAKHASRREEFVKSREMIILDIEEARNIWIKTMDQLPKHDF